MDISVGKDQMHVFYARALGMSKSGFMVSLRLWWGMAKGLALARLVVSGALKDLLPDLFCTPDDKEVLVESYPVFSGKRWIKQGVQDLCVHFMIGKQNWMHYLRFFMLKFSKVDGKIKWCRDWIEMVSLICTLFLWKSERIFWRTSIGKVVCKGIRRIAFSFHGLPLWVKFWLDNLIKRNIIIVDCCMCKSSGESVDHLLLHCPVVKGLWLFVFSLFGVHWMICGSLFEWKIWPSHFVDVDHLVWQKSADILKHAGTFILWLLFNWMTTLSSLPSSSSFFYLDFLDLLRLLIVLMRISCIQPLYLRFPFRLSNILFTYRKRKRYNLTSQFGFEFSSSLSHPTRSGLFYTPNSTLHEEGKGK